MKKSYIMFAFLIIIALSMVVSNLNLSSGKEACGADSECPVGWCCIESGCVPCGGGEEEPCEPPPEGCGECASFDKSSCSCVDRCSYDQVCYEGRCCTPSKTCENQECGTDSDGCGGIDYCGSCKPDGWYCSEDNTVMEYRDYNCFSGECVYKVTENKSCGNEIVSDGAFLVNKSYICEDDETNPGQAECILENEERMYNINCESDQEFSLEEGMCVSPTHNTLFLGNLIIYPNQKKNSEYVNVSLSSHSATNAGDACYYSFYGTYWNICNNIEGFKCGSFGVVEDKAYFRYDISENNNNFYISLVCNRKGPIDGGCDGTNDNVVVMRICDNNKIPCDYTTYINTNRAEKMVDLSSLSYSVECVQPRVTSPDCDINQQVKLYARNNLQPCGDPNDNTVCINGACKEYECVPDNYLSENEECDPVAELYHVTNDVIKNQSEISCYDFDMIQKETVSPSIRCTNMCTITGLNESCELPNALCGNGVLDSVSNLLEPYVESCEEREEPEQYLHPINQNKSKTIKFRDGEMKICADFGGYIGDASQLICAGCKRLMPENCEKEEDHPKSENSVESGCGDEVNNDYWYDFSIDSYSDKSRTQQIKEYYIGSDGYFKDPNSVNTYFDPENCFNYTHCYDCYDRDCDNEYNALINGRCNFKEERYCNDRIDNDGDGYTDSQDSDCSKEQYSFDFTEKGYCHYEDNCLFDLSELECYRNGDSRNVYQLDNRKIVCSNDYWTNSLKVMAGTFYNLISNKDKFTLYCNDYGDITKNKGYVVALNSKIPNSPFSLSDYMEDNQDSFGKFCAIRSDENYALGTEIKNLDIDPENIQHGEILTTDPSKCLSINDPQNLKFQNCNVDGEKVYFNSLSSVIATANYGLTTSQTVLKDEEKIREKVSFLADQFNDKMIYTSPNYKNKLELLENSSLTEAFVWKKNNDNEMIGIIDTVNKTTFSLIYINKGIGNYCENLNSKNINNNVFVKCIEYDEETFIYWQFEEDHDLMSSSKELFDEITKAIPI